MRSGGDAGGANRARARRVGTAAQAVLRRSGEPDWLERPTHARPASWKPARRWGWPETAWWRPPFRGPSSPTVRSGPPAPSRNSKMASSRSGPHSQGVFELRRWLATRARHRSDASHGPASPGRRLLRPQRGRRRRVRCRLSSRCACRTARCACNGRVRMSSRLAPMGSAMVVGLRAVLDANARPADWTIEIWSPVHAQRPGMNGHAAICSARKRCPMRRRWPRSTTSRTRPVAARPATRGALRPAAAQARPSSASRRSGAHLVAPWTGCFRQRLRHRVLHGRARRDRRARIRSPTGSRSCPIRAGGG